MLPTFSRYLSVLREEIHGKVKYRCIVCWRIRTERMKLLVRVAFCAPSTTWKYSFKSSTTRTADGVSGVKLAWSRGRVKHDLRGKQPLAYLLTHISICTTSWLYSTWKLNIYVTWSSDRRGLDPFYFSSYNLLISKNFYN